MPLVTKPVSSLLAPFPPIALPRRHRLLAGIVLSALAHVALIWLYRPAAPRFDIEAPTARPFTVHIKPPEPARPPAPPPAAPSQRPPKPTATPRAAAPPRPVIAMPPATNEPQETIAVTPSELTPPPPQQGAFDMDKARQQARKLANAPDPAKADSPLARLPQRPLETQTRAEKALGGAHRANCVDSNPGVFNGVLAPINLLFHKKDSGCRL